MNFLFEGDVLANPNPTVVIVNRNYPPRAGITGASACELGRFLEDQYKINVKVITCNSRYDGNQSGIEPVGEIESIPSWYNGKNNLLRLATSFVESFRLLWAARKTQSDYMIVMTDPQFLSFWASILIKQDQSWIYWAMDVYPDAFAGGGLVSPDNWIYRKVHQQAYRNAPDHLISLGDQQTDFLCRQYGSEIESTVLPCGVFHRRTEGRMPEWKIKNRNKILLGYCGNLGKAQSTEFLKSVIKDFDRERFHLVLSVYGAKSDEILEFASQYADEITVVPAVPRNQLSMIDVHLVSLLDSWIDLCVPSKAVSAVCARSSILFVGSEQCDTWEMLGDAGWRVDPTVALEKGIAETLSQIDADSLKLKKRRASQVARDLQKTTEVGMHQLGQLISGRPAPRHGITTGDSNAPIEMPISNSTGSV